MSFPRRSQLAQPPIWTSEQLDADRQVAEARFRRQRLEEPLEEYLNHFDEVQGTVENLIEATIDLTELTAQATSIATEPEFLAVFRYLAGPPISEDDLKTLIEFRSLAPGTLVNHPDVAQRIVQTIRDTLDRRRFPWVSENRTPTEEERQAAIIATAALIAASRTSTARRNAERMNQEAALRDALADAKFQEVQIPRGRIAMLTSAPSGGTFTREVTLGDRKADVVVGLWDGRIMPIECKVSNSSTNSVKRLNNDAVVKAVAWRRAFGELNVVPAALLSGVYKLHNLEQAQASGLTLYWAHRLDDLINWIQSTRSAQ